MTRQALRLIALLLIFSVSFDLMDYCELVRKLPFQRGVLSACMG